MPQAPAKGYSRLTLISIQLIFSSVLTVRENISASLQIIITAYE